MSSQVGWHAGQGILPVNTPLPTFSSSRFPYVLQLPLRGDRLALVVTELKGLFLAEESFLHHRDHRQRRGRRRQTFIEFTVCQALF